MEEQSGASSSWSIASVVGKFEEKHDDCKVVKDIAGLEKFDVEKMFDSMSTTEMKELQQLMEKYKRQPLNDTAIRAYSALVGELKEIEFSGFEKGTNVDFYVCKS